MMSYHRKTYPLTLLVVTLMQLLFYPCALADTSQLKSPTVEVKDISLISMNFSGAEVAIAFAVHNPNAHDIVVESIRYYLILNDVPVKNGIIEQYEQFPAQQQRDVTVPVSLAYDEHLPALLSALSNPSSSLYEISGSIKIKGDNALLPFQQKGRLDLLGLTKKKPMTSTVVSARTPLVNISAD